MNIWIYLLIGIIIAIISILIYCNFKNINLNNISNEEIINNIYPHILVALFIIVFLWPMVIIFYAFNFIAALMIVILKEIKAKNNKKDKNL